MNIPAILKTRKFLVTAAVIIFIGIHGFYLFVYIMNQTTNRLPAVEPGLQFESFVPFLKGVEQAGYVTDKDMSRENNDGIYLQAQFFLAPTVLQLNAARPQHIIIDSTNLKFIISTMKYLNARRLTNNEYGQALLKRTAE